MADAPGPDGKGKPGGPDPAKVKTIGDILDAARVLDPKGDEVRNRTMMAALAYWRLADNVRQLSIAALIAEAIKRISQEASVSSLFE